MRITEAEMLKWCNHLANIRALSLLLLATVAHFSQALTWGCTLSLCYKMSFMLSSLFVTKVGEDDGKVAVKKC